ncbi:MAG: hypothetical protein ACYC1M_13410 [Armatimonadota bacterium]
MSKYLLTTMAVMALVAAQITAMAVETGLAGVKLGITTPQQLVSRLGNPTMVQVNDGRTGTGTAGAAAGMTSMGGSSMSLLGGMQSAVQGYAGALNSAMGGGAPTMPGMTMPGMSMPGMTGMPGMGGTQQRGMADMQQPGAELLMIYETSGHKMRYEFLFNRLGKLKQISVYGFKDLRGLKNQAFSKTSMGIGLGDQLKKVISKYGMPNFGEYRKSNNQVQKTITFVYLDKHLALQFVKNAVAAIVVCLDKPTKYSFESPGYTSGQMAVAQGGMNSTMPGMGTMPGGSSTPSMPGMLPMSPGGSGGGSGGPMMPPGMGMGGMTMPPMPNMGR